jgi:sortase A
MARARLGLPDLLVALGALLLVLAVGHYGAGWAAQRRASIAAIGMPVASGALRDGPECAEGVPLARLHVPRLGTEATVFEGVSTGTLRNGPGHLPGTAAPNAAYGNCVIAGHRDSFFHGLDRLREGDAIVLTSASASEEYRIIRRAIVAPTETRLAGPTASPTLTLVTCYPMNWIGPAPQRLIVQAIRAGESASGSAPPPPGVGRLAAELPDDQP